MKFLVAGTARNITKTWDIAKLSLSRIFETIQNYTCVIVESNSDDNSLEVLQNWASEDSRRTVISLGNLEGLRTQRIARCRNKYLKYITDHDYLLVVDLDDVLRIQDTFKEQLESCFLRNDWDAIGSNRLYKYYDLWALRCEKLGVIDDILTKNVSRFVQGKLRALTNEEYISCYVTPMQKNIPITDDWIECTSAFGGMALYKTFAIRGHWYNGDKTCEHISFNEGLRIFINPKFISG
jgi:glycosyltransferase involved in cell wall biosynthesis